MPIIIDGYNLLRSIQSLEDYESITDVRLCFFIDKYLKIIDEKGEIIFDGTGPPDKSVFNSIGKLEIYFSGIGVEADEIIENKIKANTASKKLVIVSDDRRIRKAAKAKRAVSVRTGDFWSELQKQLARKKNPAEPTAKRQGLSESETDLWLKLFDFD